MPQPIGEARVTPADEVRAEVGRILLHEPGITRRPVLSPSPRNGSAGRRRTGKRRPGGPRPKDKLRS